jgi:hypothetical protein
VTARIDLDQLARRESEQTEWKKNVADIDDVVGTLAAFANDLQNLGGGYVVCGAKEEKDAHGFPRLVRTWLTAARFKEVENTVLARCRDRVSPPLAPLVEELESDDPERRILVFVQPATSSAHTFRRNNEGAKHFVRVSRSTIEARNGLLKDLLVRKGSLEPWDRRPCNAATVSDIDLLTLRDALQRMGVFTLDRGIEPYLILNAAELAQVWGEDETIGWVYQFFNGQDERRKMREESQAPRNSRELAVRNQFFTPRYVVQFLTDNTLGRIWYEMRGTNTALAGRCEYMVRKPSEDFAPRAKKDPRDIRVVALRCQVRLGAPCDAPLARARGAEMRHGPEPRHRAWARGRVLGRGNRRQVGAAEGAHAPRRRARARANLARGEGRAQEPARSARRRGCGQEDEEGKSQCLSLSTSRTSAPRPR